MPEKLVVLESPFGTRPDGTRASPEEVAANKVYLDACIADCIRRGEAPFASHKMYPGALNNDSPAERALGMKAGATWALVAPMHAVYIDRGITPGMASGINAAMQHGKVVEYRSINAVACSSLDGPRSPDGKGIWVYHPVVEVEAVPAKAEG